VIWKQKQDVHKLSAEDSFCDEHAAVQTIVHVWAKLTKRRWLIAVQLVGQYGSGQKYFFSGWY
jgi:hypothetical protein